MLVAALLCGLPGARTVAQGHLQDDHDAFQFLSSEDDELLTVSLHEAETVSESNSSQPNMLELERGPFVDHTVSLSDGGCAVGQELVRFRIFAEGHAAIVYVATARAH